MVDCISRPAFIADCEGRYCAPCKEQGKDDNGVRCRACWVDDMLSEVIDAPASDVEPVRQGKWEPGNPICPVCGKDKFNDLDADIWSDWTPAYCPNCGAKMFMENGNG